MELILLSGGSRRRLRSLSNETHSKLFLKLLHAPSGALESMVQRIVRQIAEPQIIEVQTGQQLMEDDIIHLDWKW